jgi:TonB family protein
MTKYLLSWAFLLGGVLAPVPALADIYAAEAAADKQDYPRAFELFRELAELGHPTAQENLAVMYVNGEGVKRDNVLGYAWAAIAIENGGGEAAKGIIAQLDPHMSPAARKRVAEVQAQFGKAALEQRLLPKSFVQGVSDPNPCRMRAVANPDDYYPAGAKLKQLSGTVLVEATVAPDGRARDPRVWYSVPAKIFDEAGRQLALNNQYWPPRVNGVDVPCVVRFKVRFKMDGFGEGGTAELKRVLAETKTKAESGDPRSQLMYGMLLEFRNDMNVAQEDPFSWFVKAAQGGLPSAQYLVGMHGLSRTTQGAEADDSKGLLWLQRAADAGQAEAQAALANYWLRSRPSAAAMDKAFVLLERASASENRDGKFHLAALLATSPYAARRDPQRAIELLAQIEKEVDFDPYFFEIRAAAQAMNGNFAAAQEDQARAMKMARKLGWNSKDAQARLASYADSKPWTGNLFTF